jgi:hypothetical protein
VARAFTQAPSDRAPPFLCTPCRHTVQTGGSLARERLTRRRPHGNVDLFESDLRGSAAELAEDSEELGGAVALYHLVLEGIVFTAGQLAFLALLEEDDALPGVRRGLELVLRVERWHMGFDARLLELVGTPADLVP